MTPARSALLATALLTAPLAAQSQGDFWTDVFSGKTVLQVHFTLTKANFDAMWPQGGGGRRGPGGPGGGGPGGGRGGNAYKYVEADLEVAGQKLERIGLRFKGNSSFRMGGGLKLPLKIDTNKFVEGQKLHGRTKLSFSNAFKDPTYLREKLGYEVFASVGLPTPGVGFAVVSLTVPGVYDKERLGFYNVLEQVDDKFLGRKLGKASKQSVLMKPEGLSDWDHLGMDPKAYLERYEVKEGAQRTDLLQRFAAFTKLVHEGSDEAFAAQIADRLDLDNIASYLAANCLLANLDSWVSTPHNFYLVVDAADGKVRILPWDLNECFGSFTMGTSTEGLQRWSIRRPWAGERRVLTRLFAMESFQKRYEERVRHLLASGFAAKHLETRIATLKGIVQKHLGRRARAAVVTGIEGAADQGQGGRGMSMSGPALLPFLRGRIASVQRQLAGGEEGVELRGRGRGGPGGGRRR